MSQPLHCIGAVVATSHIPTLDMVLRALPNLRPDRRSAGRRGYNHLLGEPERTATGDRDRRQREQDNP
jgi:hypothetical protein